MNAITLMVDEHKVIKRMLAVIRKACYGVMNGAEIDYTDFESMIDFVRSYADKHHHGKEEKILFNKMVDEIGGPAEKLIKHGMLVEHDLGRLFIKELEEALAKVKEGDAEAKLDVIANAISYTHLLHRHIDKEDAVVYTFAQKQLKSDTLDKVNQESEAFEEEMKAENVQNKYLQLVEKLERKYQ
jgi:Uncharacterized conserved protein